MKKYIVCWYESIEYSAEVEAENGDAAQDIVFGQPGVKGEPTGQTNIDVSSVEEVDEDRDEYLRELNEAKKTTGFDRVDYDSKNERI